MRARQIILLGLEERMDGLDRLRLRVVLHPVDIGGELPRVRGEQVLRRRRRGRGAVNDQREQQRQQGHEGGRETPPAPTLALNPLIDGPPLRSEEVVRHLGLSGNERAARPHRDPSRPAFGAFFEVPIAGADAVNGVDEVVVGPVPRTHATPPFRSPRPEYKSRSSWRSLDTALNICALTVPTSSFRMSAISSSVRSSKWRSVNTARWRADKALSAAAIRLPIWRANMRSSASGPVSGVRSRMAASSSLAGRLRQNCHLRDRSRSRQVLTAMRVIHLLASSTSGPFAFFNAW